MALYNRVLAVAPCVDGGGGLLPLWRQRYHLRPMRQCHADDNGCHIEIHLPPVGVNSLAIMTVTAQVALERQPTRSSAIMHTGSAVKV
jgi:hypothetical protein